LISAKAGGGGGQSVAIRRCGRHVSPAGIAAACMAGHALDQTKCLGLLLPTQRSTYLFFGGRFTPTCNTDDDEKPVIALSELPTPRL
jgi:hypothetical protein